MNPSVSLWLLSCSSDNAIPIKSWFSDPSDTALLNLLPMLDALRWNLSQHCMERRLKCHCSARSVTAVVWAVEGNNLFPLFQVYCWRALRPQSKPPPAPALVSDWSKMERGRGHGAASFLSSTHRFPSHPPFPFSEEPPTFSEHFALRKRGMGGERLTKMNSWGSTQPTNYWVGWRRAI